jgi:hypothetical protein
MDPDAICGADDKLLEDLGLCAKGDICALRSYCQGWNSSSTPSGSFTQTPESCRQERKRKLMAILQSGKKTRLKQNVAETSTKSKKTNNVVTGSSVQMKEKTRRIQLGWLHYNKKEDRYIHVRATNGGGTRNMEFPAAYTKENVLQAAIGIFFENGQSKFGFANEMEFDLANFKMEKVDVLRDNDGVENPFTIQGYFQCYKLSKARIYLMSKDKTITEVTNSETEVGCAICLHIAVYAMRQKNMPHTFACACHGRKTVFFFLNLENLIHINYVQEMYNKEISVILYKN